MEFDFEYVPIRLETKPTGAEAYIGTKRLGITPLELEYRVGNVDIIFKHGGKDFVRQVKVRKEKALQRFVVDLTEPAHGTAMTVGGMEFVYTGRGVLDGLEGEPDGAGEKVWWGEFTVCR